MKIAVYIETSVVSYVASRPNRDVVIAARQAITSEWWHQHRDRYDVYISALVEEEISAGDPTAAQRLQAVTGVPSVAITPAAQELARTLLRAGAVPSNSPEDALHIAIAATQGAEFLLTWNFKHINNAETRGRITRVVEAAGYACPVLCSPEELGGIPHDE